MGYIIFAVAATAILLIARGIYGRFERWNRAHRLRGAKECLDAVQNTLASLAKSKKARPGR
jgi:uncharacterized membrane protein